MTSINDLIYGGDNNEEHKQTKQNTNTQKLEYKYYPALIKRRS